VLLLALGIIAFFSMLAGNLLGMLQKNVKRLLMRLSLEGIPLTAGFLGKFYIIAAWASSAYWVLVLALVLSSILGLFYYSRVIVAVFDVVPAADKTVISPFRRLQADMLVAGRYLLPLPHCGYSKNPSYSQGFPAHLRPAVPDILSRSKRFAWTRVPDQRSGGSVPI
jgi:NADH:ubiquinone oxidoreductase subunit 2 (subunit N)